MKAIYHVCGSRTYDIVSHHDEWCGGDNYGRENATQSKSRPSVTVNMAALWHAASPATESIAEAKP
jgi:hypothetical protein